MAENRSPWLSQLRADRPSHKLDRDGDADVAIIGAGIAGISTAFFILKNTEKTVAVLERDKLAHGATGHNAGQVVSYFEIGFAKLVELFGQEKAKAGQLAVEDAWGLIDEMYRDAQMDIPFARFMGHAGLMTLDQVMRHINNNAARAAAGLDVERMRIADSAPFLGEIPKEHADLYEVVPHAEILDALETKVTDYVAMLSHQKGVINSALFCQEVVAYLQGKYPDRFTLYEHSPVAKVILHEESAVLDVIEHTLTAKHVVLATNGFEKFTIIDQNNLVLDHKFHQLIEGTVGYMSGYLEPMDKQPVAISYFDKGEEDASHNDELYYYLTRRPYEQGEASQNLISIGGPDVDMQDSRAYRRDQDFPDSLIASIDAFVKKTYDPDPNRAIEYVFTWHGLMGYTTNWVRLVGKEPRNPVLLYNLGCNGVGILPSVYGGSRIAELVAGKELEPSIFDVPASRS